ncbi:MAG: phosphatidylcholine synthase, partial [Variibacter sp.]|nr:phosphatidylcholine synthase [Variibacter sp.]
LVVDVLTYVFVPAYALAVSGLLPAALAWPLAVAIVVTGVLYFADGQMKSDDNHFVGFPAVWNLIAFLIFLLRPPAAASAAAIVALCVLTFVPVRFVHPFRVQRRRTLNLALLIAGMVLAGIALWRELDPGPLVAIPLCAIGLYFLAAGLLPRRL